MSPGAAAILKRLLFALLSVLLFFGILEVALIVAGVQPLLTERDPFLGFSDAVRVFELDAERNVFRTPPRATAHSFNYQEFAAQKPDNGFRFFVLGGSSALGFPWGAQVAFPRILADALQVSRPDWTIEGVNAAAMSYGSHRLRILARELLRYEPDALIVYGGHNEFVERRFYRELIARPTELDWLRKLVHRWRLYSALARRFEQARRKETQDPGAEDTADLLGLDVSREYEVDVGEQETAEVLRDFEDNFRQLLADARAAGVTVVLCTVPSNLSGWVPDQSFFAADVGAEQRRITLELLESGRNALDRGDAETALVQLERARGLTPRYAEVHYRRGQALAALGRHAAAREAFVLARDTDGKPSRAVSEINDTIRRLADETKTVLVDVERLLLPFAASGVEGFDLFEDYVHPKPATHKLIAFALWTAFQEPVLGDGQPADPQEFWEALGLAGPPDLRAAAADSPAADGTGNPSLLFNMAFVLENQGRVEEAMRTYRDCLALNAEYHTARLNLGRLLHREGLFAEAAEEYRRALDAVTIDLHRVAALVGLGEALQAMGQLDAAIELFERATVVDPGWAPGWRSLGMALAVRHQPIGAEAAFRRALDLGPEAAEVRTNLGFALLMQGKPDEAEQVFRRAIALHPHYRRSHDGLAAVLTDRGAFDEAQAIFTESLIVDPGDDFARNGLVLIGKRRAARSE